MDCICSVGSASRSATTSKACERPSSASCLGSSSRRRCCASTRRGVHTCWILCTTRMVFTARALACGLPATIGHAVVLIGLTLVERDGLRVFRSIGDLAIRTNTRVCEGVLQTVSVNIPKLLVTMTYRATCVLTGPTRTSDLVAENRAGGFLIETPLG